MKMYLKTGSVVRSNTDTVFTQALEGTKSFSHVAAIKSLVTTYRDGSFGSGPNSVLAQGSQLTSLFPELHSIAKRLSIALNECVCMCILFQRCSKSCFYERLAHSCGTRTVSAVAQPRLAC